MSATDFAAIATLRAQITKHLDLLQQSHEEIAGAISEDIPRLGRSARAAVLVAGLLENYYTCAETIFVRISQFFENNLDPSRRHKELLERHMTGNAWMPWYTDVIVSIRHFSRNYTAFWIFWRRC